MRVGDVVWYRGAWGEAAPVLARVTRVGDEKNGRQVVDCHLLSGESDSCRWGYLDQFSPAMDRSQALARVREMLRWMSKNPTWQLDAEAIAVVLS